jgi:hypothetical protein
MCIYVLALIPYTFFYQYGPVICTASHILPSTISTGNSGKISLAQTNVPIYISAYLVLESLIMRVFTLIDYRQVREH